MSQAELDALKRAIEAHRAAVKRMTTLNSQQEQLEDMLGELQAKQQ